MVVPTRAELLELQRRGEVRALRRGLRRLARRGFGRAWSRFGLALGHVVSPLLLGAVYLTIFLPFGIIGRSSRRRSGLQPPKRRLAATLDELRSG